MCYELSMKVMFRCCVCGLYYQMVAITHKYIEPWGIQQVIDDTEEEKLLINTLKDLLLRSDDNQSKQIQKFQPSD